MLAVRIRFTAGQYHATPWGAHVNEGIPEWPPSPWRLLRALTSVWRRTSPDITAGRMEELISALASPPQFRLPMASAGHTRHYMPQQQGTALVFDPFIALAPHEEVLVFWPDVQLSASQRALLADLLDNLPYLGRAESWCRAELAPVPEVQPNCAAAGDGSVAGDEVAVLCSAPGVRLGELLVDTGVLRSQRRHDPLSPPGSRWVTYRRPTLGGVSARHPVPPPPHAEAVRFRIDANPLPAITEALAIGDLARTAAMARFGREHSAALSQALSGRAGSEPAREHHRHAHYLVSDEDGDGRLDHLTIWAPGGLSAAEVGAVCRLDELRRRGPGGPTEMPPLRLTLLGSGPTEALPEGLRGPARVWQSATPFILPRHPKIRGVGAERRWVDDPEAQVRQELAHRGLLNQLERVEPLAGPHRHWGEFRRWRPRQRPPVGGAYGFRLIFREPALGPLALGFGSHFGLGLFVPAEE